MPGELVKQLGGGTLAPLDLIDLTCRYHRSRERHFWTLLAQSHPEHALLKWDKDELSQWKQEGHLIQIPNYIQVSVQFWNLATEAIDEIF